MQTLILATLAVLAVLTLRELPPWQGIAVGAVCGFLLLWWQTSRPFGVALCAALWLLFCGGERLESGLDSDEALVAVCRGTVQGLPREQHGRIRFRFRVLHCNAPEGVVPLGMVARVSWYRVEDRVLPGERWRLTLKLRPPTGRSNPHVFDYETWLFSRGIGALGTVQRTDDNTRLAHGSLSLDQWRWSVRERLRGATAGLEHAGLMEALVVGSRDRLDPEQRALLSSTGAAHLVAISGLHIGMVAGIGYALANGLWWAGAFAVRLPPVLRERRVGAVLVGLVFACTYAALAGFSLPTLRALIMLGVFSLCLFARLTMQAWIGLSIAFGLIFVLWPLSVLDAGFWMSFLAVLAIVVGLKGRRHWSAFQQTLWVNTVIGLVLTPITVSVFGAVTWLSPLANLLLVPLFGFLLVPCVLLASALLFVQPTVARWLFEVSDLVFGVVLSVLVVTADAVPLGMPSVLGQWALAAVSIVSVLLLMPRSWTLAPLCALGALILAFSLGPSRPVPGTVRLTVLDVGHGLAVVVETRSRTLVYDTGPRYGGFDTGASVVAPVVVAGGRSRVDTLVVSHADNDHAGGVAGLLRALPVDRVLRPENGSCAPAVQWTWDAVTFSIEHPSREDTGSENDRSCVLRVQVPGGQSALLLGDVEARGEAALVRREVAPATLILVPHHGSKTSSGAALLDQLAPRVAINSHTRGGRFVLPHPSVVAAYAKRGIPVFSTADSGALRVSLPAAEPIEGAVLQWRRERQRFWHRITSGD